MPKGGHTNWFRELFGFEEGSSYSKNKAHFKMDGEVLVTATAPTAKRMHVGPWSTPSLGELREQCAIGPSELGGLTFTHLADPVGVVSLITNPDNAGAVFQAASQFNALEMTGPGVSPKQGIARTCVSQHVLACHRACSDKQTGHPRSAVVGHQAASLPW